MLIIYIYIYIYIHIHRYVQPETCTRTTDVMLLVSPSRWPTLLQSHPTPEPAAICSPHLSAKQQRNPRGRSQSCLCPPRRSSGPCTACKTCEVTTIARVRISVSVSEPTRHKNKNPLIIQPSKAALGASGHGPFKSRPCPSSFSASCHGCCCCCQGAVGNRPLSVASKSKTSSPRGIDVAVPSVIMPTPEFFRCAKLIWSP